MKFPRALFFVLSFSVAQAADAPDEFAYAAPIELKHGSGLARLTLPQEVYQGSVVSNLADLRIFDSKGSSVPYAREPRREVQSEGQITNLTFYPMYSRGPVVMEHASIRIDTRGKDVSVQIDGAGGGTHAKRMLQGYLIDLKTAPVALEGMEFHWRAVEENRMLTVNVEQSDDLRRWSSVVQGGTLAAMRANGQTLVRNTLEFPSTRSKYMRVTFGIDEPIPSLTSIHGQQGSETLETQRQWKEFTAVRTGTQELEFDLGGEFPLDRLKLLMPGNNIVLPLEILSRRKESEPWSKVAAHTFYRIQQADRAITNPDLALSVARVRYWKLRLQGREGMPEGIRMRIGWVTESLVFVAQGEPPFRLAYGHSGARDATLSVTSLVPGFGTERAPHVVEAVIGPQQTVAGASARMPRINTKTTALWAALVIGVTLLGWMAWSLSRQMRK